jgi:hypothetical protein
MTGLGEFLLLHNSRKYKFFVAPSTLWQIRPERKPVNFGVRSKLASAFRLRELDFPKI